MTEKQQKINEWKARGIDWCANTIWNDRKSKKLIGSYISHFHMENTFRIENSELKQANERLRNVLDEYNIKPDRLRLTYIKENCENCKFWDTGEDYFNGEEAHCAFYDEELDTYDPEGFCEHKSITETVSFYTWRIDDGHISGIRKDLEIAGYQLLEAVDLKTGKTVYQFRNEDNDV